MQGAQVPVLPQRLQDWRAHEQAMRQAQGERDPLARYRFRLGRVTARAGETAELDVRLPAEWGR